MPELPEVEVTRRGIAPHVEDRQVTEVILRRGGLRWPFPPGLSELLQQRRVLSTGRRGKYLLLNFEHGTLIIHLGMSGHLRVLSGSHPPQKHDHVDVVMGETRLRLTDPRRFGAVLWHSNEEGDGIDAFDYVKSEKRKKEKKLSKTQKKYKEMLMHQKVSSSDMESDSEDNSDSEE